MKTKVINLFFDRIIEAISSYGNLDMEFYTSKYWPARPNSTARLNLMNYTALNNLGPDFDVKHILVTEFNEEIKLVFDEFDYVIIHQNASKKTFQVLRDILSYLDSKKPKADVIFGTEATWSTTREFLSEENIDDIYKKYTLLRHTAKTDRDFYNDEDCLSLNVREFELGIDTNLLSMGKESSNRTVISFVAAPEGRKTKNNDLIYLIKAELEKRNFGFTIKVLEPPYSSKDYWETMANTAFFIFTSDSETFSYCLNDAKALGAITFFPTHMFCTKIGARFVVDNYIESSFRYSEVDEILDKIKYFISNPDEMKIASLNSRQYIIDHHSIDVITENWKALLSDIKLPKRNLYIYDRSRDSRTLDNIVSYCKENDVVVAMPYMNLDEISWVDDKFFNRCDDVSFVKYYLSFVSGTLSRGLTLNEDGQFRFGIGADVRLEKISELIPFLSLVKRINKIDDIIIDGAINNALLKEAVDRINCKN